MNVNIYCSITKFITIKKQNIYDFMAARCKVMPFPRPQTARGWTGREMWDERCGTRDVGWTAELDCPSLDIQHT